MNTSILILQREKDRSKYLSSKEREREKDFWRSKCSIGIAKIHFLD